MGAVSRALEGLGLKRHANLPGLTAAELIPARPLASGVQVTPESSLRSSAVWACLRLRADLISTLPLDAYRSVRSGGQQIQTEIPKPPVLIDPDGTECGLPDWLWATQHDLDRYGNTFGLITQKTALDLPARIELVSAAGVSYKKIDGKEKIRIDGTDYDPSEVWHETQYRIPGMRLGLSPVGYAAWTLSAGLSAQEFAASWFASDAVPSGHLRNTAKTVSPKEASVVKDRFRAAVAGHDLFVTGNDWEYSMVGVPANATQFIEQQKWSISDIARYLGVPADMIDAESGSGNITYANVTQRNLQLLILNLNPPLVRRESAMSRLLPGPNRSVRFNRSGILAMDPLGRSQHFKTLIDARVMTPDEARAKENLPPLTEADYQQFERLFAKKTEPQPKEPV